MFKKFYNLGYNVRYVRYKSRTGSIWRIIWQ